MIYYFSGTGNSREIALRLAQQTNDTAQHICKEACNTTTCSDNCIGFVFPVYGWTIPPVMKKFIEQLSITASNTYIYMVCTCGDDAGHTDRCFYQLLNKKQRTCQAAWSIQMPDTYIGLPGFYIDEENVVHQKLQQAWKLVSDIANHILQQHNIHQVFNGKFAWTKTHILGALFHRFLTGDSKFKVDEHCTRCGKCAKICPTKNITYNHRGLPTWNGHCTDCLACYHHCPHNAIQYGPYSKGKGQYRIPHNESYIANKTEK